MPSVTFMLLRFQASSFGYIYFFNLYIYMYVYNQGILLLSDPNSSLTD